MSALSALLKAALDQVGAPAAAGGVIGDAHAFCRASGVVGCRFAALRGRWPGVFLGGSPMLVLSSSFAHDPRRERKARRGVVITNRQSATRPTCVPPSGAESMAGRSLVAHCASGRMAV
jgi:hypothetical protein